MFDDTIVAISTSNITASAISIIRMSGEKAFEIINKVLKPQISKFEGYRIYHGKLYDLNNELVDDVLVNVFVAPKSYTGQDMIEINCHGGIYNTRRILSILLGAGARQALNGEFTKRAYLNNKMDLTQAEAVNDFINADNKDNSNLAINSLAGSINKMLSPLIDELEQCISHIEVNIDYPEYDDNGIITSKEVKELLDSWLNRCNNIIDISESGIIIKEGIKTVIVGKPNVGKSSLLNALLAQDKAIVSEIAGTTRDLVEGDVRLKNVTLHLIDTAGIHQTDNSLEQKGIEKSQQALQQAQLVIVVIDGSKALDQQDYELLDITKSKNRIVVYNKKDIVTHDNETAISAINNDISELVDKINEMFEKDQIALTQPVLINQRQIGLMLQAKAAIEKAQSELINNIPLDLVTEEIQEAYRCCKEILGKYTREDLLDSIFSRFCVGK